MKLEIVKEKLNDVTEEITQLIKENGSEMYSGVLDVIESLRNKDEYWLEFIEELKEDFIDEDEDEDNDSFINMILVDSIDRKLMEQFGKQFATNLKKLGYTYDTDDESWNLKDKQNGQHLTCYGVIWDYWYDLDTDVRESVSDIFEREIEGIDL